VVVLAVFAFRMYVHTEGHRCAPLDDTFIHLQYARQIAAGEYYQYQSGDEPTTGASSWLYVHLLALPALAGLQGGNLLTAALVLDAFSLYLALLFLLKLARRIQGTEFASWVIVLCLSSGAFMWNALSGMEVALFACALAGCALACRIYLQAGEGFPLACLAMGLLGLIRPEAGLVALTFAGGILLHKKETSFRWRWLAVPLTGVLLYPFFNLILTGRLTSSAFLAKSEWTSARPYFLWNLKETAGNLRAIILFLLGYSERWFKYLPPAFLLFVLAAAWPDKGDNGRKSHAIVLILIAVLLVFVLSLSTLFCYDLHHWRYVAPFLPLLFLLALLGIRRLSALAGVWGGWVFRALAAAMVLSNLLWWPWFAEAYGRDSGVYYKKHHQLANWMNNNLPSGARIAVNDAGILPYQGGHHFFDLVGLVTRGPALPFRAGFGPLVEFLENLPESQRFDYYAVFPAWFPGFDSLGLWGEEVFSIHDPYTSEAFRKGVYPARWDWARSGHPPFSIESGWQVRDRLDVGELASEAGHSYRALPEENGKPPGDLLAKMVYHTSLPAGHSEWITDGGRRLPVGEQFTLSGLQPGVPARLVMRTGNPTGGEKDWHAAVRVSVDGEMLHEEVLTPPPWRWQDHIIRIPARRVQSGRISVTVTQADADRPGEYAAFHYWLLQPGGEKETKKDAAGGQSPRWFERQ
jgi:MFS family permease